MNIWFEDLELKTPERSTSNKILFDDVETND
jgi:hypothetical protein